MKEEARIILQTSREYIGRHLLESKESRIIKDKIIFTQENYDKVMKLNDLDELVIGLEIITAEHFRNNSMKRAEIEINPDDSKYPPKDHWRKY